MKETNNITGEKLTDVFKAERPCSLYYIDILNELLLTGAWKKARRANKLLAQGTNK